MEPKYERAVFDIEQTAIILFGASEQIVNSFVEKTQNNALLITCNQDSEICKKYSTYWGITDPALVGYSPKRGLSKSVIATFDDFEKVLKTLISDKNEPPPMKSEPIPENNDEIVKVIVGRTFRRIVNSQK